MALVLKDRVLETCAAPGTGTVTLLGAVTGYQAFSTVGNGNTCYYAIADQSGSNWEVGIGTYSSGTLARTTVLSSSNAGALTNFSTGTQNVFLTYPSERSVNLSSAALTSGRVSFATTDGLLTDSAGLTWDGSFLTATSIKDTALTNGRVTYAGASGVLQDNANFVFDGTNVGIGIAATANSPLAVQANTGNTAIRLVGTSFSGTSNAGIYWYDSNNSTFNGYIGNFSTSFDFYNQRNTPIIFSTNGAEKLRITGSTNYIYTASGVNVGIGTSSPNALLEVYGGDIRLRSTSNGANGFLTFVNTSNVVASSIYNYNGLLSLNEQLIINNSTGRVGIGTSSPTSRLTIGTDSFTSAGSNTTGMYTGANGLIVLSDGLFIATRAGVDRLIVDTSGNLGLGITPSAWKSGLNVFQAGTDANGAYYSGGVDLNVTSNVYLNSASANLYKYGGVYAAKYNQYNGNHNWYVTQSAVGADNPVTFTQAMTLDASGQLSVGTTSAFARLTTSQSPGSAGQVNGQIAMTHATATTAYFISTIRGASTNEPEGLTFKENATERMRIDSAGNVMVNSSAGSQYVQLQPDGSIRSVHANGVGGDSIFSAITGISNGYQISVTTGNAQTYKWHNGGAQSMTLDSSGNLGIGQTNPTVKLDILNTNATYSLSQKIFNASAGTFRIGQSPAATFLSVDNFALAFCTNSDGGVAGTSIPTNERMRILSSGDLLLGTTSSYGGEKFTLDFTGSAQRGMVVRNTTSTTQDSVAFIVNSTFVGWISASTTATSYNTISDYRLKENVVPMTGALAKVAQLKPVTYKWKTDGSDGQGFIAHELAEVCPSAVSGYKDAVDENGKIKPQGVDTSFLVATLTKAIQEQQALIESLTTRLTALENK